MTTGDHLWDQKEVAMAPANRGALFAPAELSAWSHRPGQHGLAFRKASPVAVLNLQGRTFMPPLENPFLCGKTEVELLRNITKLIFVDMHAEATSEKIALARMLDGRVKRRGGNPYSCADRRRADFPRRHRLSERRRVHRPA